MSGRRDDPQARSLLDGLTSIDNLLRQQQQILSDIRDTLSSQGTALERLSDSDGDQDAAEYPFDLSANVDPETTINDPEVRSVEIPYDGIIEQLIIGYSDGTDNLAGITVGRTGMGERFYPRKVADGAPYTALNNVTVTVDINEPIDEGNSIEARFVNLSTEYRRFLAVLAVVSRRGEN